MSKVYSALLKRLTICSKRSEMFGLIFLIFFLNFKYQISIEFCMRNTLLQKFIQTDRILFDLFKVPTIKFGKNFTEFMKPLTLLKSVAVNNV